MKELALLMFFIGCGYVAIQLLNRFSTTKSRRICFYYPSTTSFNLLWGFIFYLGFGLLIYQQLWLRIFLGVILLALLTFLLFQFGMRRHFTKPNNVYYNRIFTKRLLCQQEADRSFEQPYTRSEALIFLGLPRILETDNPQIIQHLNKWINLSAAAPDLPYLREMLEQLQQALTLK